MTVVLDQPLVMQPLDDPSNGEWGTRHRNLSFGSRPQPNLERLETPEVLDTYRAQARNLDDAGFNGL